MTCKMCPLPWTHLSIMPDGVSSICCSANHRNGASFAKSTDGTVYNANVDSIRDIITSDTYNDIRRSMINGEEPDACSTCYNVEHASGISKRQQLLASYNQKDIQRWIGNTAIDGSTEPEISNVELRLGNVCNLKCRTCNAASSSAWIPDTKKLQNLIPLTSYYDPTAEREKIPWYKREEFYTDLVSHMKNVRIINLNGGEPFLVNDHRFFIQQLANLDMSNVILHYITNLNFDQRKVTEILNDVQQANIKNVSIACSIDDTNPRNKYIRSLSDWELMINNLKFLIETYPKFSKTVVQTVSAYNFLYIEQLYEYLKIQELIPSVDLVLNHVHSPESLTANVFSLETRRSKIDSLEGVLPPNLVSNLANTYYNSEYNGLNDEFLKFTDAVDNIRSEKISTDFNKIILELSRNERE